MNKKDIIISPYDTTMGSHISVDKAKQEVSKYISVTNNKLLGYEFLGGVDHDSSSYKNRLVIITGFDHTEKELPLFDHPLIVKDLKGYEYVAVDVRKYIKPITEQPVDVLAVAKDQGSVLFIVLRALLTIDFIEGNTGVLSNQFKAISSAYGMFIANILSTSIGLNPMEKLAIEITGASFANMMFVDNKDIENMQNTILGRLSNTKFSLPFNVKYVQEVLSKIDPTARTIDELVNNIKLIIDESKATMITKDVIINLLSSFWFGPGDKQTMIMSLEHAPTWVALMYASIADRNFRKSRLAMMLEKFNKSINPSDFEKALEQYIKNRKHTDM